MDIAVTAAEGATVRPGRAPARVGRIARRVGLTLVAPFGRAAQETDRETLAELHERRLEAARLREETFRGVAVTRLL